MLLAKCLGLKYCINNLLDFILAQATTSQLESEVTNLKSRLEFQESELEKANSKFEFSVSEQEKLKKDFEAEKKAWADEKTALISRAEKAEAALEEVTGELSGLKRHISQMVAAIFGKSPCHCVHILSRAREYTPEINFSEYALYRPQKHKFKPQHADEVKGCVYLGGTIVHRVTTYPCFGGLIQ